MLKYQLESNGQGNPIGFTSFPHPFATTPSNYFIAQAGPGASPPIVYLWTGERGYDMSAHRMWDFNTDGWAHVGLYPEVIQDLQNVGVTHREIAPLFASAERYIEAWRCYSSGGCDDTGLNVAKGGQFLPDPTNSPPTTNCFAMTCKAVTGENYQTCLRGGELCPGQPLSCPVGGGKLTFCDTGPVCGPCPKCSGDKCL